MFYYEFQTKHHTGKLIAHLIRQGSGMNNPQSAGDGAGQLEFITSRREFVSCGFPVM